MPAGKQLRRRKEESSDEEEANEVTSEVRCVFGNIFNSEKC